MGDEAELSLLERLRQNGFATRTGFSPDEMSLQKEIVNKKISDANQPMSYTLRDALLSAIVQTAPGLIGAALAGKRGAAAGLQGGLEGGKIYNKLTEDSFASRRKADSLLAQTELEELQNMRKQNTSAQEANLKNLDSMAIEDRRQKHRLEVSSKKGKSLGQGLSDISKAFLALQQGSGGELANSPVEEASDAALEKTTLADTPERRRMYSDVVDRFLPENTPQHVRAEILADPGFVNKVLTAVKKDLDISESEWESSIRGLEKEGKSLNLDSLKQKIEKERLQIDNIYRNSGLETEALELGNEQKRAALEAAGISLESTKLTNQQKQAALSMVEAQKEGLSLTNLQKGQSLEKGALDIEGKQFELGEKKKQRAAEEKEVVGGSFVARPKKGEVLKTSPEEIEDLASSYFKVNSGFFELKQLLKNATANELAGNNQELNTRLARVQENITEALIDINGGKKGNTRATEKERNLIRNKLPAITGIAAQFWDKAKRVNPYHTPSIRQQIASFAENYENQAATDIANKGYDIRSDVKVHYNAAKPSRSDLIIKEYSDGTVEAGSKKGKKVRDKNGKIVIVWEGE